MRKLGIPETAVRVQRRHLKLEPGKVEDFIDYLIDVGMLAEVRQLTIALGLLDHFVVDDAEAYCAGSGKTEQSSFRRILPIIERKKPPSAVVRIQICE